MASLTTFNILLVIFVAVGGFSYGFAFSVFVSSIGQPGFYAYFSLISGSTYAASILGAVNALFYAGAGFGAISQGWFSDRLGRRRAMFAASLLSLVGSALIAGSANIPMLIVMRFIQGLGLGMSLTLAPLYISEVAPPQRRGLLVGAFAFAYAAGTNIVSWISFGTYYSTNLAFQWRFPLSLACVTPLFMCIGVWFIPESPRWLIWNDRAEEAWKILQRLHSDPADTTDAVPRAEYVQIIKQVEYDKQFDVSYWQMFKKPSYRKRSLLVMFLLFAAQSTGVLGIGNYKVLIYTSLGLTKSIPLLLNAAYTLSGTLAIALSSYIMDRTGRRTLLLIGYPATAACLLAEALLQRTYLGSGDKAGNAACVFFLFLYITCFDLFIDASSFVYIAEIWPTTIRSKGIALAWFAYFIGAITYTAPSAIGFQSIKWEMYMIWFSCNIVSTIIIYFFLPETKGKSMEEMGDLFGDEVVVHMAKDGATLVEIEKMEAITIARTGAEKEESMAMEGRTSKESPSNVELESV